MPTTELVIEQTGKRWAWQKVVDGKVVDGDTFNPNTKKQRVAIVKAVSVPETQLLEWIQSGPGRYEVKPPEIPAGAVIVRALEQNRESGRTVTDVLTALRECTPVDQVIDWESKEQCCCLDVDYHTSYNPGRDYLETVVLTRIFPRPSAWHFSRSGGLHLFYVATEPFLADELAAVAALRFRMIDPTATVELKRMARGPGKEPVHYSVTQDTTGANSAWLAERTMATDAEIVSEYCDEHGLKIGGRHNHDKCPIHPTKDDGSYRQPVLVSDTGVYCFVCEGKGRSLGCRRAGYAPWGAILDDPSTGDVGLMVRNLTHWGHAKWIFLEKYGLPEWLARMAYRAACKSYHCGKDSAQLIDSVFHDHVSELVRVENGWRTIDGYNWPTQIGPLLHLLPQCRSESAVCLFQQGIDLTRYGFPKVEPIHGFKLASVHLPPPKVVHVSRSHPDLVAAGDRYLPRYVPRNVSGVKRKGEGWAWDQIEAVLPGIDRKFVKFAMCAMACAQETRLGMLPLTFVSGPTGVGKSSTLRAAGGIVGAQTRDILFQSDETRYLNSLRESKQGSAAVQFNEILKEGDRGKGFSPRKCLEFFLGLSETAMGHVLHVGSRPLGKLPAIFMSEPCCPPDLREYTQLARRIRDYRLTGEKKAWQKTLPAAGLQVDNLHKLRVVSTDVAEACNVILSEVVDEFFDQPRSFDTICEMLGVYTIRESPEFDNPDPFFRDFFRQVCLAPAIDDERLLKVYCNGFKQIQKTGDAAGSDLAAVYTQFADGPNPPQWLASQKLSEKDWSSLLGVDLPVQLDLRSNGVSVFVRFRTGPLKNPTRVNEQIVDPNTWGET